MGDGEVLQVLAAGELDSVMALTRSLVRVPSRGGLDEYGPVVEVVSSWLTTTGLQPRVMGSTSAPTAVVCEVGSTAPGRPHYVLDACLDTADTGTPDAWSHDPFAGDILDGWLRGRGSADSKAAVAIFCHVASRLAREGLPGALTLLFDLDEHTGGFAGIRSYLETLGRRPDGVLIGYPGPDKVVTGGRGFLRARFRVSGVAAHTGSSRHPGVNAAAEAAGLVAELVAAILPGEDAVLGLPPKLTVTSVQSGVPGAYSVVPDRAEVEVDVRLTSTFDSAAAWDLLTEVARRRPRVNVEQVGEPWPAYRLPADHRMVQALREGARLAGLDPTPTVAGPSNIGCLLSQHGIPATAGFGVAYRGLHAADEAIDVSSIPAVYAAYYEAVRLLLG